MILIMKKYGLWIIISVVIIAVAFMFFPKKSNAPTTAPGSLDLDAFAKCITDKGAKLYGASWCPHCQSQKELFGNSAKDLPYVECSAPDRSQTKVCADAKIEGYPTWVFTDGSRQSGEMNIDQLAQKTGCKP
jgi:thiol-disulfide isomerase/thioredoxin